MPAFHPILAQALSEVDSHRDEHAADPHATDPHAAKGEHAADGEHGEGGHEEGGMVHLPTVTALVSESLHESDPATANLVHTYENFFYLFLWMGILLAFLASATRKLEIVPRTKTQLIAEFLVVSLRDFVLKNLGEIGRPFIAFIGSLFVFIWINNLSGQVPLMKPITADFHTTIALSLCVFFVVQFHGIKELGFGGWFMHLAGLPDAPLWLAPINLPLHIIGELVKPLSLALRLFGNIFGEEMLVTAFVGLGAAYFLPLHFPFYFLSLLVTFIQAMVFTLLTCAYIGSMSHHGHGEHEHDEHHHDHAPHIIGEEPHALAGQPVAVG